MICRSLSGLRFSPAATRILLPEVERLLRADIDAGEFIKEPAAVDLGLAQEQAVDPYLGQQIDCYKIVKEIGHGGMGTVYLANHTNESFDKQVALKLIKRGMDTNAVLTRFVMERRILAQLQHRFIANLLDGGSTSDGLPYFVMEHVEGLPITKFCDSNELSINERLELFRKVCSAISYAHQNLVVHRDIKPSNIMVTEDWVCRSCSISASRNSSTPIGRLRQMRRRRRCFAC